MISMESCTMAFGAANFHEAFSFSMESPLSSTEASTGYLQDAVVEWSERCKRLRTITTCCYPPLPEETAAGATAVAEDLQDLLEVLWGSNCAGSFSEDLDSLLKESSFGSGEMQFNWEEETEKPAAKAQLEEGDEALPCSSPASSSHEKHYSAAINCSKKMGIHYSTARLEEEEVRKRWRRRRRKKKVAYPFTVLKPAGIVEGDVTLAEINERILMRPRRPVRHPVGEFACAPCVQDAGGGPGLSGKTVVGLTRIHTQGRGTVTIIRTRG